MRQWQTCFGLFGTPLIPAVFNLPEILRAIFGNTVPAPSAYCFRAGGIAGCIESYAACSMLVVAVFALPSDAMKIGVMVTVKLSFNLSATIFTMLSSAAHRS